MNSFLEIPETPTFEEWDELVNFKVTPPYEGSIFLILNFLLKWQKKMNDLLCHCLDL